MEKISTDMLRLIDLEHEAFRNSEYRELIETVSENADRLPDLRVVDGVIYKRAMPYDGVPLHEDFAWKMWVPMALTQDIIVKSHDPPHAAHGGFYKTL